MTDGFRCGSVGEEARCRATVRMARLCGGREAEEVLAYNDRLQQSSVQCPASNLRASPSSTTAGVVDGMDIAMRAEKERVAITVGIVHSRLMTGMVARAEQRVFRRVST